MEIADKVISSEAVFTGLENEAKTTALAIKGNKILAVGYKRGHPIIHQLQKRKSIILVIN